MKLGDGTSIPASKLQYGTDVSKYEKNAVGTLYLLANTMLFDDFEPTPIHASGTPLSVTVGLIMRFLMMLRRLMISYNSFSN